MSRASAGWRHTGVLMSGLFDYVSAHPGLLLFTALSVVIVAYLLYAMVNPSRF
jgi:hypothetical protein